MDKRIKINNNMKEIKSFKLSLYQSLKSTNWANPKILKDDEEVEIISVDTNSVLYQNYPILLSNEERCSINGKLPDSGKKLRIKHDIKPPIIEGRLVSDKTFALRFKNFLEGVSVCDACGEEELDYLKEVANDLLKWQISTVSSEEEKDYLKYNGIDI